MSTEATGRRLNEQEKQKFDFGSWTIIYLTVALFLFLSATRSTSLMYPLTFLPLLVSLF